MEQGELNLAVPLGTLTVNSILLSCPAWVVFNMAGCLHEADIRGGDRLISHATGVLGQRRRRTVTRRDFPLMVTGVFNSTGARYANAQQGLIDNIAALKAGLAIGEDAPAGETGTVTALWTQPLGATKSAAVHVIGLPFELHGNGDDVIVASSTLSLSFPDGVFA